MTEVSNSVVGIDDVLMLSPLQQGLFAMANLSDDPCDDPYLIRMAIEVSGPLDTDLLRACAAALLDRHPALRACFLSDNLPHPVQVIPSQADLPWREFTAATPESANAIQTEEQGRGFDLRSRSPRVPRSPRNVSEKRSRKRKSVPPTPSRVSPHRSSPNTSPT